MELSITRSTMNKRVPYATAVRAAHAAGFGYVELSAEKWRTALDQHHTLADLLGEGGIRPWHAGWNLRLGWEADRWTQALAGTPAAMDLTASLGARSGTLVLPHVDDTGAPIPPAAEVKDRIGAVADLAVAHGLNVCVEYMGLRPADPPENGVRTLAGTLEVLARVGRSNAGVLPVPAGGRRHSVPLISPAGSAAVCPRLGTRTRTPASDAGSPRVLPWPLAVNRFRES
ncbi:TIM barrel protein [Kitasatospora purpeofusca]|uniref:TIM barrel protein n=1 Tax=Kitasatospora purpeofusca TaxID=67352 RepID=UPI00364EFBF9